MSEIKRRSYCGISSTLDILGDKWSLLIIRDIMFRGKSTYGDFLKADEKIATNILAIRLSSLESSGIIVKQEHPENKVQFLYKLTKKGIDLLPVLIEILLWSEKHFEISEKGKAFVKRIKEDREGLIKEVRDKLESL